MNGSSMSFGVKGDVIEVHSELPLIPIARQYLGGSGGIIVDKAEAVDSPHQVGLGQVKSIATPVAGRQ